ncbi:WD40-repeat-containing domain protein [Polychytrium aggregatum]|uniref:WD40-repeat-containing domain protein n=1 Tax=Polychytrium aggregatum TaxID=110093 RepID=UPI0022FEB8B8|nr:WD40-repeat-containing domain protein [Polychytrium aggregatum]KAI9197513.1 WD40-repeat-containing domain protein [Polychytrium aggregatum]
MQLEPGCDRGAKNFWSSLRATLMRQRKPADAIRFAYCSTLALYIYAVESEPALASDVRASGGHSVSAGYPAPAASSASASTPFLGSCAENHDLLAVASIDKTIVVVNVLTSEFVRTYPVQISAPVVWMQYSYSVPGMILFLQEDATYIQTVGSAAYVQGAVYYMDVNIAVCALNPGKQKDQIALGDSQGRVYISDLHHSERPHKNKIDLSSSALTLSETNPFASLMGGGMGEVTDLKWDVKSDCYLLAAFRNGRVVLIDSNTCLTLSIFDIPSGGISTLSWIPSIPGGFLTTDVRSGVLRTWTVSSSTEKQLHRLLPSAVHAILAIPSSLNFSDPLFLIAFLDGSIGVFNLKKESWLFLKQGGHTETIFECDFKRNTSNAELLLATASFDGTVKIWGIGTSGSESARRVVNGRTAPSRPPSLSQLCIGTLDTSLGYETGSQSGLRITLQDSFPALDYGKVSKGKMKTAFGAIYSVSWSPTESILVLGTALGFLVFYDATRCIKVKKIQAHHEAVYRVTWGSNQLVASAGDCECAVWAVESNYEKFLSLRHPEKVFGCDWSPTRRNVIATTCMDGVIRIWDIETGQVLRSFSGHTKRSFRVVWSPILRNILASGSDDRDVRIWDIYENECTGVLQGHTKNVRALCWSSEIAHVLLSGSWDSTIRIWDIRTAKCIQIVTHHHADVYGLSTHPSIPLGFVSTSRDNTLRVWYADDLVRSLSWKIMKSLGTTLRGRDVGGVEREKIRALMLCESGRELDDGPFRLSGTESKKLFEILTNDAVHISKKWAAFFDFIMPSTGTRDIWEIVQSVADDESLDNDPSSSRTLIQHHSRIVQAAKDSLASVSAPVGSTILSPSTRSRLQRMASQYIRLGLFREYCQLLVALGRWESAIAFAPHVGIEFWKELIRQYAAKMLAEYREGAETKNDEIEGWCASAGMVQEWIGFLVQNSELEAAYLVAKASNEAKATCDSNETRKNEVQVQDSAIEMAAPTHGSGLLAWTVDMCTAKLCQRRQWKLAAAFKLAIDDLEGAISILLKGEETMQAYGLATVFGREEEAAKIERLACDGQML